MGRDRPRAGHRPCGVSLKGLVVGGCDPAPVDLAAAARVIREGGLVAFPTETFYGLGANALDPEAVERVFRAKERPAEKPLLVLVDSRAMVEMIALEIPIHARTLIERYWPGPLTVILRARPHVPSVVSAGTGTIGVRVSSHPVALALVRAAMLPITAPSANTHGAPSPRTAAEVRSGLGTRLDLVLDGGRTPGGQPSTVVDATAEPMRVVRRGAIALTPEELRGA